MALDKLVDSQRLNGAMTETADKIRAKLNSEDQIEWDLDDGFKNAVDSIVTLTEGSANATATANDILNGKTAYVKGSKVTGNIPTKTSDDMTVSGKTVTVPKGYYTSAQEKSVADGAISASVSSNQGGSASIAATGFTPLSNGTSSYYVALSTFPGSVKAAATVGTPGYVSSSNNKETAATSVSVSGNGNKIYIPAGNVTTSFAADGMSTYFNSGTSSDKNVTITPKYTNTAGYKPAVSTATNNGGTAYYKIKTTSASVSGKNVTYGTGWITANTSSVADGEIAAGISSNTAGSASMSATGFTAASSATDYYVTLATNPGSVKASASVSTDGYVTSDNNVETAATNVAVTGNGNKVYIPTTGVTASVSSNSAGSASMAATGFTASSSATSYYVTLSTSPGTVKAKAVGNGTGIITNSTTNETAATNVSVSGNGNKLYIPAAGVTTSFTGDGMSTYFNSGTSTDKNVTITPKYTNTAGYKPALTTATNNGGTSYYKIKTTSATAQGKNVTYGTGWITSGSTSVADGAIAASVSENNAGSASMAATGFTPLSGTNTSSYYVTLSTSPGSVKAAATVGTEGYVTSENDDETAETSVAVTGSGTKLYIPAGSAKTPATTISSSPTISIDANGLITATNSKTQNVTPTVSAGYVASGTAGTITVSGSNTSQMTTQGAQTITPTTANQTIASGTYLTGTQTIAGDADLVAANIKKGVNIFGVTGTFTTTPSGKTALTAAALRSGYAGFINGSQVNGSMPNTTVTTGTTSVSGTTATRGTWSQTAGYTAARTISAATFANSATSGTTYVDISETTAAPILKSNDYIYINPGWTDAVKISLARLVPDASDVGADTVSSSMLNGYTAYNNEGKIVTGNIQNLAASDVTFNGKTVTIPVGLYTGAADATAISKDMTEGTVTTSFTGDGMSTYFNSGTSSNKNVTITPKYTNTAGYIAKHETATNNGGTTYYKIKTASPTFSAAPSGESTAESGQLIMDTTSTSAGIEIQTKYTVNAATISYAAAATGWISKAKDASTGSSTTAKSATAGTKYYVTGVTVPASKSFAVTNNGTTTVTAGSATAGSLTVSAYNSSGTAENDKAIVTDGKWNATSVSASGTYYGRVTVDGGTYSSSVASQGTNTPAAFTPKVTGTISDISTTTAPTSGTDGTDYWTITPGGDKTTGKARAKATATISQAGYIAPGSYTTSSYTTWNITTNVNTGTARYIPKAVIAGSSTNATATTTVAPGAVTITKQATPSGVTNAASGDATATAPSSGVYVAVLASAAANGTGTTSSISGSGTATVSTAGYAPTTLTGSVTVSGTATAKTSKRDSSVYYVPITTAVFANMTGGGLSGTATASSSTATLSDSSNSSGISFTTACTATRAKVSCATSTAGWASGTVKELAKGSTALTAKTYYINAVSVASGKAFTVTNNGTTTITNNDTTNVTNSSSTTVTSASATTGSLSVNAYNNATTPALTGAKSVVTNGKWTTTNVSASGTYYGMVNVAAGAVKASVSSNTGGSASMAATGFTAASSSTSYYVTLSTTAGSVKAKAQGNTAGYISTSTSDETSATSVAVSGNGNKLYIPTTGVTASVSSNTGGSASMAATGFTASSSATSYYVTLSTTAGSVKAKAVGNGTGIVTTSTTNETAATSVAVSGNGNKVYIPVASPTFSAAPTGGSTASSSTASISNSTNNSGVSIQTAYSINAVAINYAAAAKGMLDKVANTATGSNTTAKSSTNGTLYYINSVTLTAPSSGERTFTVNTPAGNFTFHVDSSSNVTVTEA